ncbi:MAG: ribonuclease III, partial [Rickettsiales bacterium]|nr:ribonuclease III [Rickettsiales bacterium]
QLQDWCLKNKKILPSYSVINKVGPDHDPVFKIRVFISDDFTVTAKGKNKQKAEIKAAQILLKKLNNE